MIVLNQRSFKMYCSNCGFENEDTALSCIKCDRNLSSVSSHGGEQLPYVGFWKRFIAIGIDTIVLNVLGLIFVIAVVILEVFTSLSFSEMTISLFIIFIGFLYFAGFESSTSQATPGKQAIGVKVTDLEGNRISFLRAAFRHILKIVTALMLGLGYLAIAFSRKKQGLYEWLLEH